jgi:hypothetical protein
MKKRIIVTYAINLVMALFFVLSAKGQTITVSQDENRKEKNNSFLISVAGGPSFKAGGSIIGNNQFGVGIGFGFLKDLMFVTSMANFKDSYTSTILDSSTGSYPTIKASTAEFLYSVGTRRTLSKVIAGTGMGIAVRVKFTDITDGGKFPLSESLFWQFNLNDPWSVGKTTKTGILYFGLSGRIFYTLSKDPSGNGPAGFTGLYQLCLNVYFR